MYRFDQNSTVDFSSNYLSLTINNHIVIDLDKQILLVMFKNNSNQQFRVSTSKYGVGGEAGSYKTPIGKHVICEKIGEFAPMYTIFKSRINTGKICEIINFPIEEDVILTRILRLQGKETGVNSGNNPQGECVDSYKRCIYIHGTNREDLLSTPASNGCIRMANNDIIELFNIIEVGTEVSIESNKYCFK